MKKVIIGVLIVFVIGIGIYIGIKNLNKNGNSLTQETFSEGDKYFENLIKYEAESIKDEENLQALLKKMEFGDYLVDIKKEFDGEKEYITVYYNCNDAENVKEYYANFNDLMVIEKNTVTLFALIKKLEKVAYDFDISNEELIKEKLSISPEIFAQTYAEMFSKGQERVEVENRYNQDVRNYVQNPSKFMKYDINLDINSITIYMLDSKDAVSTIDITEETHINNITQYIKNQNFQQHTGVSAVCTTWVDLNNGYILGLYGDGHGCIVKGNGKEIFTEAVTNVKGCVNKKLPTGLTEYIENMIKEAN